MSRGRLVALVAVVWCLSACASHRAIDGRAAASGTPAPDEARGRRLYAAQCAACHGSGSTPGPVGPSLAGEQKRRTRAYIESIVRNPEPPMPKLYPAVLSNRDVRDIVSYVETL